MQQEPTISYRKALRQALREVLYADDRAFLMGEDVGRYGGAFAVSKGLLDEFGPERIMDTPLSESGFVGAGIGAAMAGMRPIVEIMTINFSLLAMDQIVNNAATLRHMSGGQVGVPIVIRMGCGIGRQLAAQHSHSWEPLFAHIAGLTVLSVGTLEDARWMLPAAMRSDDPVVILEYTSLLNSEGILDGNVGSVDIRTACVRRHGSDVTLITYGTGVPKCLAAAERLAESGIDAEVLDLRVLRPLDEQSILASVLRTHRAVVVEDAWRTLGVGAEVSARIMEHAFRDLASPVLRVAGVEVPIPYPKHLEDAAVPQVEGIIEAVRKVMS
ncbi:MAG: alpha-ketoacid dehydrogenase subunit beta [Candidatus Kapabacteria bacterium]|nr:alpha-ketoacid dehydrogenase subunit beta [Candidatus Kapabacteria bacterium]